MKIVTIDGKEWEVKYQKNRETVSFDVGTNVSNYPAFVGSKLNQNSSSSDKYSLSFSIHKTQVVAFKESLKLFLVSDDDVVTHADYGKLTHIIIEHADWGLIRGSIISAPVFNTASEGDILITCSFQEHTPEDQEQNRDLESENETAEAAIDTETQENFDVDLSEEDRSFLGQMADSLNALYSKITNSAVVQAFNDLNSELSKALMDSKRVMRAVKNIISLPSQVTSDISRQVELFTDQAEALKAFPATSYNTAIFSVNSLSYNCSALSRTIFTNSTTSVSGVRVNQLT